MRLGALTGLLAAACLAGPATAVADPGEDHGHHDDIPVPAPQNPNFGPGTSNLSLVGLSDKDGVVNSDLAFWGRVAYAGNYGGFRVLDIGDPASPAVLADVSCRGVQGDVSVFKAKRRLWLLQSIDRPVTEEGCDAVDTPTVVEEQDGQPATRARFGWEGLRLWDVTNPRAPQFVRFYRTPCGSHTHTLVPGDRTMHAYVSSYPLGTGITPQVDSEEAGALACRAPHKRISIVDLPLADPTDGRVRAKALSSDTEFYDPDGEGGAPAFQACHDLQAFLARNIMVGSCAGDAQYWDISSRSNPTSADGEPHTHISNEPEFDFIHNAMVTWDGEIAAIVDESGGGVEARCDGPDTVRGFTYFYPLVEPGDPAPALAGRYTIPRPQSAEICVSHNGNAIPTGDGRDLMVQAFYQGGNSFYELTDPANPQELGFADLEDAAGKADSWSSYWYNGHMWVNGGLNRRGATGNRGLEAYALTDSDGEPVQARRWRSLNPQTQEAWQAP